MGSTRRLTISIDADLARDVEAAVADGLAPSVNDWVAAAMRERVARDRRPDGLGAFLDAYEAEFGAFSRDELAAIERRARARSIIVGG